MMFDPIIIISGSLLLLSSPHAATAASARDGGAAINAFSRGGASIDGGDSRNKRFSLNRLRPPNRTSLSPVDRRRSDVINSKRNTPVSSSNLTRVGSGEKMLQRKRKKFKMYMTCIGIVFSWLSLSTLFYAKFYDWPYPQVSNLHTKNKRNCLQNRKNEEETEVASRLFTIVHILLGASCIGGVLVLLVNSILEGVYNRSTEMYKVIVERYSFDKAFKAGNGRLSYDEFNNVLQSNGCILSETELKKACSEYDLDHNGFIQYEDFDRIFEGIANIVPSSRYINSQWLPLRVAARAFDSFTSLFTDKNRRINILFIFWIGVGVAWGMRYGWDPITATHFAVSALATGGLTAPKNNVESGYMDTEPALFCAIYSILGIPLFSFTLTQFARVLIEKYYVEDEYDRITQPLSPSEFEFASRSLCSTDDSIHLSDFVILQLFRQGKLSVEELEYMRIQFKAFDKSRDGRLSRSEATLSELDDDERWVKMRNREKFKPGMPPNNPQQ